MARLQHKSLEAPDEVRSFPKGRVDIVQLDDVVIGRNVFEPGWRWSHDVAPVAGTKLCQYHHLGVILSGTLHVVLEDGTEMELGPEGAYEIPPGHDAWVIGDEPWVALDFAGMRAYGRPTMGTGDRVLKTILFTDIVDSTARATGLGDGGWRELLSRHNEAFRWEIDRFYGREINTTGDGFLVTFDGAERAVQCAAAMVAAAARLDVEIRAGVHTGEVELVPGNIRGVAVHMAARIMSAAGAGEVWVSSTTRELLDGSPLHFESRGRHALKGIDGERELFSLGAPLSERG